MKVEFRESFAKDLRGVKAKGLLGRVREVIDAAEKADSLAEMSNLKKLKGGGKYFRVKVGDYCIGITLENNTIVFVRVLNRKDIYKHLP